jgi:hypothetical protein
MAEVNVSVIKYFTMKFLFEGVSMNSDSVDASITASPVGLESKILKNINEDF